MDKTVVPDRMHGTAAADVRRERVRESRRRADGKGKCRWPEHEPLLALSAREALTAEAVFERMFPADDNGPGRTRDRRRQLLDRALAARVSGAPRLSIATVWHCSTALARPGSVCNSHSAAPADQDELLADLERGGIPGWVLPDQVSFFALLRSHLQEGLFSDPAYGGNRDKLGWRVLGHPGVWLENSAEENLSPEPVTKGGRIQSIADVTAALHQQQR